MQYRKFGRLDWQVSALGFGLENLPLSGNEAVKMLRYAMDSGVNYIDAGAPPILERYAPMLRAALKDGYRQKVKLAAALPPGKINAAADFDRELEGLLKLLDAGPLDFLLLGGLNRFTWPKLAELKIWRRAEAAIAAGKIGHLRFFFHDQFEYLREIIRAYDGWKLCQFHYSFMDVDHHPGASGLTYAADNGLAVVIGKPLLGGRLTRNLPPAVAQNWAEAAPQQSPAAWGLKWAWNHREAAPVVCDMSNLAQVKETVALADSSPPDSLGVMDELAVNKVRDAYFKLKELRCTACRGCMPCPVGIDVPRIFEIYNDFVMYGDGATAREIYRREKHNLDDCTGCGLCVSKCGKNIRITDWFPRIKREMLGE